MMRKRKFLIGPISSFIYIKFESDNKRCGYGIGNNNLHNLLCNNYSAIAKKIIRSANITPNFFKSRIFPFHMNS